MGLGVLASVELAVVLDVLDDVGLMINRVANLYGSFVVFSNHVAL